MSDLSKAAQDKADAGMVTPSMSLEQIEDARLMVDLPFDSPLGAPSSLQYDDLGESKGWQAPDGFTIAGVPYAQVVANVGGGAHSEG